MSNQHRPVCRYCMGTDKHHSCNCGSMVPCRNCVAMSEAAASRCRLATDVEVAVEMTSAWMKSQAQQPQMNQQTAQPMQQPIQQGAVGGMFNMLPNQNNFQGSPAPQFGSSYPQNTDGYRSQNNQGPPNIGWSQSNISRHASSVDNDPMLREMRAYDDGSPDTGGGFRGRGGIRGRRGNNGMRNDYGGGQSRVTKHTTDIQLSKGAMKRLKQLKAKFGANYDPNYKAKKLAEERAELKQHRQNVEEKERGLMELTRNMEKRRQALYEVQLLNEQFLVSRGRPDLAQALRDSDVEPGSASALELAKILGQGMIEPGMNAEQTRLRQQAQNQEPSNAATARDALEAAGRLEVEALRARLGAAQSRQLPPGVINPDAEMQDTPAEPPNQGEEEPSPKQGDENDDDLVSYSEEEDDRDSIS